MRKIIRIEKTTDNCIKCSYHCEYELPHKLLTLSDGSVMETRGLHMCYHEAFILQPKFLSLGEPKHLKCIPIPEWCPLEDEEAK